MTQEVILKNPIVSVEWLKNHLDASNLIVLDATNLTHNAHQQLKEGTPMSISNLKTHILANGDRFTLNDRKIEVLSIHEEFV